MWQVTEAPWFFAFRHRRPLSERRGVGLEMNDMTPIFTSLSLAICVVTVTVRWGGGDAHWV